LIIVDVHYSGDHTLYGRMHTTSPRLYSIITCGRTS